MDAYEIQDNESREEYIERVSEELKSNDVAIGDYCSLGIRDYEQEASDLYDSNDNSFCQPSAYFQ